MGHYLIKFNRLVGALQVPGDKAKILTLSRQGILCTQGAITLPVLMRLLSQKEKRRKQNKNKNK